MANNKKWIIGGSITLLLLFGASLGTGALIGVQNKSEDNFIKIHLGDEIYDQPLDLGTDSTSDEEKATLLEKQFYSAALFGSFDADATVISPNYIYDAKATDWNLPFIYTNGDVTEATDLQNEFIKVKFLSDTEDSSVYTFLNGLSATVNDQALLMQTIATLLSEAFLAKIPFPAVTGLDIINGSDFAETRTLIFELLTNDSSYVKEVQKDMLVYTYLWQSPAQSAYDYIFTRELVYSSPSIVYSMVLDGEEADLAGGAYDTIAAIDDTSINVDASTWNGWIGEFKGDVLIDDTIDQNDLVDGGMQGYQGIKFGTSAGANVSSDWTKWNNTWINDETGAVGDTLTTSGSYTHNDVLNNANLYLADKENGSDGEGAAIFDTSSESTDPEFGNRVGERTVYAYSQLYPFMFREIENKTPGLDTDQTLGNEQFALFAEGDSASGYTPAEEGSTTATYIFDEWFTEAHAIQGEIYVAEALVGNNSALVNNALRYWNNKGFYIELSGTYEDSFASYLPSEILFDE